MNRRISTAATALAALAAITALTAGPVAFDARIHGGPVEIAKIHGVVAPAEAGGSRDTHG